MAKRPKAKHKASLLGPQKAIAKKKTDGGHNAKSAVQSKDKSGKATHAVKEDLSDKTSKAAAHVDGKKPAAAAGKKSHGGPAVPAASTGTRGKAVDTVTGKRKGTLFSAAPKLEAGVKKVRGTYSKVAAPASIGDVPKKKSKRRKVKKSASAKAAALQELLPEFKPVALKVAAGAAAEEAKQAKAMLPQQSQSNWEKLKEVVSAQSAKAAPVAPKRRFARMRKQRQAAIQAAKAAEGVVHPDGVFGGKLVPKSADTSLTPVVAMDCEMVGVGIEGKRSALARVCLINEYGNVLLDIHVQPKEAVTDYRTKWSGIRASDLVGATSLDEAMQQVHDILSGRVVVGHALHNDFKVLMLESTVPPKNIRDTAVYAPLMSATSAGAKLRSRPLRMLADEELGVQIQAGEHSPVDDSRAALYVYHKHKLVWEAGLKAGLVKVKGLKAAGKIAKGDHRQMSMRASEAHVSKIKEPAPVADDGGEEYARPSAEAVAKMKAKMSGAEHDDMADL